MKRERLSAKMFLAALLSALLVSTAACSLFAKNDGDETTPEETQVDEERVRVDLTEDYLNGTWVDEGGFVCSYDKTSQEFRDGTGNLYDVSEITEDGIWLTASVEDNYAYLISTMTNNTLPLSTRCFVSVVAYEDGAEMLGCNAVKADSDQGEIYITALLKKISGRSFDTSLFYTSNYDDGTMSFNDDLSLITASFNGNTSYLVLDSDNLMLRIDDYLDFVLRYEDDHMMLNGGLLFLWENDGDRLFGNWILWDKTEDELSLIDLTEEGTVTVRDIDSGDERQSYEEDIELVDIDSDAYSYLYLCAYHADFIDADLFMQTGMLCFSDLEAGSLGAVYEMRNASSSYYLLPTYSVEAQEMIRRNQVVSGTRGQLTTQTVDVENRADGIISVTADVELYENEWFPDRLLISRLWNMETTYQSVYGYDNTEMLSDVYNVVVSENSGRTTEIKFVLDPDMFTEDQLDHLGCYWIDTTGESMYAEGANARVECTIEDNGTVWIVTAPLEQTGVYALLSTREFVVIDEDNFFDTDPCDSEWAICGNCGDIPGLVDLGYIEYSIDSNEYGPEFWISNPIQLASFTYFVNVYPTTDDYMVTAHFTSDIDLSSYNWAPIGTWDNDFRGIIFGNGRTIRNLSISNDETSNAFIYDSTWSSIVGLNIEDAVITGRLSSIFCRDDNVSTTWFEDCHATGTLVDRGLTVNDDPDALFGISMYGNTYVNCSYAITTSDGTIYGCDDLDHDVPERTREVNWVADFYDPDHDGVYEYDPEAEYDSFCSNPNSILTREYYLSSYDPAPGTDVTLDSDGDGLADYMEIGGICGSNGFVFFTDPYNADTDGDGLTDGQEAGVV